MHFLREVVVSLVVCCFKWIETLLPKVALIETAR